LWDIELSNDAFTAADIQRIRSLFPESEVAIVPDVGPGSHAESAANGSGAR
jgi:hypothetical protein